MQPGPFETPRLSGWGLGQGASPAGAFIPELRVGAAPPGDAGEGGPGCSPDKSQPGAISAV